jgi:hypothetical protein
MPPVRHAFDDLEILKQASALLQAYDSWSESEADPEQLLRTRFPLIDEQALRILDFAEEQALERQNGSVGTKPRDGSEGVQVRESLPALIARLIERDSAQKAAARERSLRLLGIPRPTWKDFAENDEVGEIVSTGFGATGIVNHMAVRHARRNELDLAVRYMTAALLVCPVHLESLINRGKASFMLGRREEGLQDYELAYALSGGGDQERDPGAAQARTMETQGRPARRSGEPQGRRGPPDRQRREGHIGAKKAEAEEGGCDQSGWPSAVQRDLEKPPGGRSASWRGLAGLVAGQRGRGLCAHLHRAG